MIGHRLVLDKSRGSAESVHGNTFTADKAFNEISDNDDWHYCSEILKKTGWIAYEFQRPVRLSKYVVEALNSNGADFYSPVDWTFEGSMDGTNWVALDEQTGHTLHKDQIYEFPLAPPTPENAVSCDSDIEGETSEDEHNYTYDFTADHTDYVFDTCLTDFDTILHILDSNGNALHFNDDHNGACDFDGNNEYASHLEVQLTPGEQYTLKISGYCASCYGPFTISVGCPETEVGVVRKVSISAAQRRRERAPARAARRPGLRRIEDDAESELELEEGVGTVYEVVGNVDNAITVFAMIGALTMTYYAFKEIQKMMFATGDFKKIKEDEIECYSR